MKRLFDGEFECMKKVILTALLLSVCFVLAACGGSNGIAVYSANLGTDAFYNIAASKSMFAHSPMIVSDEENIGDVHIRVLDDRGQIVGSIKTVSPGRSVTVDEIPAFSGTCTIQGKAAKSGGNYMFKIR